MKGAYFVQTNAAFPSPQTSTPFTLLAAAQKCSSIGLSDAVLQLPGGTRIPLETNRTGFLLLAQFESSAMLDAAYPDGIYTLAIQTLSDGAKTASLTVVSNAVPFPHVINWGATQAMNADADFLLQWEPFTNGNSSDWIKLTVRDEVGSIVFETADPVISGQAGLLDGTSSQVLIPGETLISDRIYSAELMFAKVNPNAASYPGVIGMGGSFKSTLFTLRTTDVRNYGILKGQLFRQTDPSTLISTGYVFDAFVNLTKPLFGMIEARFRAPGARLGFMPLPPPDYYEEEGPFSSVAELNAAFPNGIYFMVFKPGRQGAKTISMSLTGDTYPASTPRISNYAGLQKFNAGVDFTLTWAPLGGTSNDFVHLEIVDASTNLTRWETPQEGEPRALNGTNTSVVIPAGTLDAGSSYLLYLTYEKSTLDFASYPGVTGLAGYYNQTLCPFRAIDISGYGVMKGQVYLQTNSSPPKLQQYEFSAFVDIEKGTTNLSGATLRIPSSDRIYSLDVSNNFEVDEFFPDKTSFDAQFAPGNYVLSHLTTHEGVTVVTNLLPADRYPATAPQISNFEAAQRINCGADFALSWQPLNSSTNEFVWVAVDEASAGETVFSSPWMGNARALNGTHTSIVIPARTLRAGYSYRVTVMHAALAADGISYPGALGLVGYNKQTQFMLTVPGTAFPKTLKIVGIENGKFQLGAIGEPGRTNILESATSLGVSSWTVLSTNVGAFKFSEPLVFPTHFYRLRDATAVGP